MQIINDYFLMTVDQRYESTISPSGIITLSSAWIHEEVIERFDYKRIYGKIQSVPLNFTEFALEPVDPGYPNPKVHLPAEFINQRKNSGYKRYGNHNYNCAGNDGFELITRATIAEKTDIRVGDKVYFDPRATEDENLVGRHNKHELFKIAPEEIVCTVRDGEILMQGEWCLVEPNMESWEEITTKAGIIMKPRPEAKFLQGIMRHFQYHEDLLEGDHIVYVKGADWTMDIEGKKYYAIEWRDIVAKIAA